MFQTVSFTRNNINTQQALLYFLPCLTWPAGSPLSKQDRETGYRLCREASPHCSQDGLLDISIWVSSGFGMRGAKGLALFRIGFQIRARYQVDAIRDRGEHRIQAVVDRGRFAGQVDDQAVAAYPGGLP
jgi:hypothetical protein